MEISLAGIADFKEVLEVQKKAFKQQSTVYQLHTIAPMIQTLDEMLEECTSKIVLKATVNKTLVGSVRACQHDGTCTVNKLVVLPEHQKKGIGRLLMLEIERYFPQAIKFVLETGSKSEVNIKLYKQLDYQVVDQKIAHNGIEAVIMQKTPLSNN